MEEELELGKIYTVDFLLNFLSESYRQNTFLATANELDLTLLPRDKKFVVDKIQSSFLHKCITFNTYTKNKTIIFLVKPV